MRDYAIATGFNIWQDPLKITLQKKPATDKLLGCATYDACTCMVIPDSGKTWLKVNSSIIAHELAHSALWRVYVADHRIGNNGCHYALNAGWQLVRTKKHRKHGTLRYVVLDLKKVLSRINTICHDVEAGCAPLGKDVYW